MQAQPSSARLKVFLGMAAGVGKTYRMLQEGKVASDSGLDVVIGYLEPHDRSETVAQATGLEVVPRLVVEHREAQIEEMDLAAVLRRAPSLCLVDELAHTNASGMTHAKRYEDINDLLAAGIDVYTTMNVQHLETLNDEVAELTGTRVRETVPDSVLARADEIVLIDLTPEALTERLLAGKIYREDRVPAALSNFFKAENLTALRTLALRRVADDVETKRLAPSPVSERQDRLVAKATPQAIAERALALVTPHPRSQRVVRRAWRSAQRLGSELDVLWVAPPNYEPTAQERQQLDALRDLTSVLGAHFWIESGDDVAQTVRQVARQRGTTYVLLGPPSQRQGVARLRTGSLVERLLHELPGVDLRVIADRSLLADPEPKS